MKKLAWNMGLVAIALGTAWAIRGQFGHEHGAAWAGAIGVLSLLVLSGRKAWFSRMPAIVAIGAIGWGVGGMMSYGQVVGYGRGTDFINVSYGLLMLFVIGGLYGFIGGGFTGLALESSQEHKPKWASLIAEMVTGGFLFWGILIYQLEWLMTPPRSELWAACLGAALALAWFSYRNGYRKSLKVALFSALGAGFGFAFGNFLQTLGYLTNISFNWWNVMEYTLGFFGGLGMAYGVFSQKWDESVLPDRMSNQAGWLFLIGILPVVNIIQTFESERLGKLATSLGMADVDMFVMIHQGLSWGIAALFMTMLIWYFWSKTGKEENLSVTDIFLFLLAYLAWYILLSNLIDGTWLGGGSSSEYLYWANWLVLGIILFYRKEDEVLHYAADTSIRTWVRLNMTTVILLLFLSFVLILSHDDLPGVQVRFE